MDSELDAYRVLQVDPKAEQVVLRAAYLALVRRYHPDAAVADPGGRLAELNRAYDLVRDPERRRGYDARRRPLHPVGPGLHPPTIPFRQPAPAELPGDVRIDFGRYAGWRLADLVRHDPDYLRWLSRHSGGVRFRQQIRALLPGDQDLERRASVVR